MPLFAVGANASDGAAALERVVHSISVTTTADAGAGSLRDAILRINELCRPGDAECKVTFDLPPYSTFAPLTPLPAITACGRVEIDGGRPEQDGDRLLELSGRNVGTGPGLEIRPDCEDVRAHRYLSISGLAINGFPQDGVHVQPEGGQLHEMWLRGLFVGTDFTGTEARPNGWRGIAITSPSSVVYVFESIVSGNRRSGVWAWDSSSVAIAYSSIGIGSDERPMGNGASGVFVLRGRTSIAFSTIAHNAHWGATAVPGAYMSAISQNSFYSNGVLGVDWGVDFQTGRQLSTAPAAPVITGATYDPATNRTTVRGTVEAVENPRGDRYEVALYSNRSLNARGFVEGEIHERTEDVPGSEPTGMYEWEVVVHRDLRGWILTAMTGAIAPGSYGAYTSSEFSLPFTPR